MRLAVLDYLSDPGDPDKSNEDALCHADHMAAVFDGATGLGDAPLFADAGSDAAWLAKLAARRFDEASPGIEIAQLVRDTNSLARSEVSAVTAIEKLARHAWPASSFAMARLRDGGLELSGLGDCVTYVRPPGGELVRHCPIPDSRTRETAFARELLDRPGGFGENGGIVRQGPALEALRKARARHNTPGGAWTLGLEPGASMHVQTKMLAGAPGSRILLMSDGFCALAEAYDRYDCDALLDAAGRTGLAGLCDELRRVEHFEDAEARRYPRFKRSDDATAILAEIVN